MSVPVPNIGQVLGHYRLLELIGAGGMGVVYRAHDEQLDRDVALKVLPAGTLADEASRSRFRKEALALAKLNHPNVATVHEFGSQNGIDFLVTEYIAGITLDAKLTSGALPQAQVISFGIQLAQGLAAAHDQGVIHRDLKPGNLRLTPDGRLKILDFGLARLVEPEGGIAITATLTQSQEVTGTLPYMAPEQLRDERVDARSDIWAAGTVLYEMSTARRPFPQTQGPRLIDAILHEDPKSPSALNALIPEEMERVILRSIDKDPTRRYQSARELLQDLELVRESLTGSAAAHAQRTTVRSRRIRIVAGLTALVVVLAGIGWWSMRQRRGAQNQTQQTTVAVLPFQNLTGDQGSDFLRYALPDQIVTTLSYFPGLAVRPFAMSRTYTAINLDVRSVARELRVSEIVTGQYIHQRDRLQISLEAIDMSSSRVNWRKTVNVAAEDLIAMQNEITTPIRQGLVPTLGISTSIKNEPRPKNAEAYDLYLRSLAFARDSAPNKEALAMLERAVGLDPTYAPGWTELGSRYAFDSQFGEGGVAAFQHSGTALERATNLDPNMVEPAAELVLRHAESGDVNRAYDEAEAIVQHRPDSAFAHFALSYALRYAGLFDEAAHECDTAFALDPGDSRMRSCVTTFQALGRYDRAMDFVRLDAGSDWAKFVTSMLLIQQGKLEQALEELKRISDPAALRLEWIIACLQHHPAAEVQRLASRDESVLMSQPDSESIYNLGRALTMCGQRESALRLFRYAVQHNYCGYPDRDPALAQLRTSVEFASIRADATACQQRFLEHRRQRLPQS